VTRVAKGERTRTRLDPEVRREQIIDAAEAVFAGREANEVTLEEIAEAAGVSRALVYNYFGDKSGVIAAVYLRSFDRLDAQLATALDRTDPVSAADRLAAIVEIYLCFASDNAAAWKLMGTAEATVHPMVQQARRDRYEHLAESWGGTPEARLLARGVVGFLDAATLDWLETRDLDRPHASALIHAMLWAGLGGLDSPAVAVPGTEALASGHGVSAG
jgi:AcrR family transcriptional regulator